MKIILRKDVDNLGRMGEIREVKDGFARNYLIPKGFAFEATEANLKRMEQEKKDLERKAQKEKREALALAEKIKNSSCTITVKVGEEDRIFGAVTNQDIAQAYEVEGVILDKKAILLEEPIKELGVYYIPIRLHPEVTVEAKVWVVKE